MWIVFVMGMILLVIGLGGMLVCVILGDVFEVLGVSSNEVILVFFIEIFLIWFVVLFGVGILVVVMLMVDGFVVFFS